MLLPKQQSPALLRALEMTEVALNKTSPSRHLLENKASASPCQGGAVNK